VKKYITHIVTLLLLPGFFANPGTAYTRWSAVSTRQTAPLISHCTVSYFALQTIIQPTWDAGDPELRRETADQLPARQGFSRRDLLQSAVAAAATFSFSVPVLFGQTPAITRQISQRSISLTQVHLEELRRSKTPITQATLDGLNQAVNWKDSRMTPAESADAAFIWQAVSAEVKQRLAAPAVGINSTLLLPPEWAGFVARQLKARFAEMVINDPKQEARHVPAFVEMMLDAIFQEQNAVLRIRNRLITERKSFNPPAELVINQYVTHTLALLETAKVPIVGAVRTLVQTISASYKILPGAPRAAAQEFFNSIHLPFLLLNQALFRLGYALDGRNHTESGFIGSLDLGLWQLDLKKAREFIRGKMRAVTVTAERVWPAPEIGIRADSFMIPELNLCIIGKNYPSAFGQASWDLIHARTPAEVDKILFFPYGKRTIQKILHRNFSGAAIKDVIIASELYDDLTHELGHLWSAVNKFLRMDHPLYLDFLKKSNPDAAWESFEEYIAHLAALGYSGAPLSRLYQIGVLLPAKGTTPHSVPLANMADRLIRDVLQALGHNGPVGTRLLQKTGLLEREDISLLLEELLERSDDEIRSVTQKVFKERIGELLPVPPADLAQNDSLPTRLAWLANVFKPFKTATHSTAPVLHPKLRSFRASAA